ncbi:MAG: hypothetical protein SGJ21_14265 [Alphaproteobacteria bacterium]|nr:hypothetical protein [Alphaproteobacteria bacterium]
MKLLATGLTTLTLTACVLPIPMIGAGGIGTNPEEARAANASLMQARENCAVLAVWNSSREMAWSPLVSARAIAPRFCATADCAETSKTATRRRVFIELPAGLKV